MRVHLFFSLLYTFGKSIKDNIQEKYPKDKQIKNGNNKFK